jgi:hypothetical protein
MIRGELHFRWIPVTAAGSTKMNVDVWLGEPWAPESEKIMECDASFVPDLISGLSAMLRQRNRG